MSWLRFFVGPFFLYIFAVSILNFKFRFQIGDEANFKIIMRVRSNYYTVSDFRISPTSPFPHFVSLNEWLWDIGYFPDYDLRCIKMKRRKKTERKQTGTWSVSFWPSCIVIDHSLSSIITVHLDLFNYSPRKTSMLAARKSDVLLIMTTYDVALYFSNSWHFEMPASDLRLPLL